MSSFVTYSELSFTFIETSSPQEAPLLPQTSRTLILSQYQRIYYSILIYLKELTINEVNGRITSVDNINQIGHVYTSTDFLSYTQRRIRFQIQFRYDKVHLKRIV